MSAKIARVMGRESQELVESSARVAVEAALREGRRADADSLRVTGRPQGHGGVAMSFLVIAHLLPDGVTVVEMERDPVLHQGGALPRRVPTPASVS